VELIHDAAEISFFDHIAKVGIRMLIKIVVIHNMRIFVDAFLDLTV